MPKEITFNSIDTEIIINLYQSGTSCRTIGKQFNCSKQTINKILRLNNIEVRDNSHAQQKYQIDENIFENIDTHEKAYWLGMLTGDGCITDTNDIVFSLEITDTYLVFALRDFFKSNHPIRRVINGIKKDGTESISSVLTITNKKINQDLRKYGFTKDKTHYIKFPEIEDQFLSSYFLGLVDSDGSMCIKNIKGTNYKKLKFSFVGPNEFASIFQSILIEKCNVPKTKLGYQKNTEFISIVEYGGYKDIFKIIKFLYSANTIFMKRKKEIAVNYLLTKYPKDEWLLINSS